MTSVISIIGALLVLTALVFVHELGHYTAGRILGFRILEFAIGMGPVILHKEVGGISYAVRLLPIGGSCKFHGEDEGVSDSTSFNAQKVWKRMIVVLAGPFMNVVFAVLIAMAILMSYGDYMGEILEFNKENAPAQEAGMQVGDVIVAIDGKEIMYYALTIDAIMAADSDEARITVLRDGERLTFTAHNIYDQTQGKNVLGITISPVRISYGFFGAAKHSVAYVWAMLQEMLRFLGSIFTQGISRGEIAGPVGTISIIGQAVRDGVETVLRIGVLISANLALINVLPLPALDGGRFIFMVVELIRGKPVPPEAEGKIHFAGLMLLFAVLILLTVQDISTIIGGFR